MCSSDLRIDYLLYGGPDLTATSSVVMPAGGSDHLPVRADFTLGGIKTEKCSGDAKAKPRDPATPSGTVD